MKKPPAKKPLAKAKAAAAWAPVPVIIQIAQHQAALKAAKAWKPVPVAVQRTRHQAALKARNRAIAAKVLHHHVARKLPLAEGVACCAAEALAASLRRSGRPVTDADVLALYRRTAAGPDTGATILATLEAACEYGLAGIRPVTWTPAGVPDFMPADIPGLILGLDLPGPHAVLDDGVAWWSWGEPWSAADFPDAVIEEAWAVTWA